MFSRHISALRELIKGRIPDGDIDEWITMPSKASAPDAARRARVPLKFTSVSPDKVIARVHPDWSPRHGASWEGGKRKEPTAAETKARDESLAKLKEHEITIEGEQLEEHKRIAKEVADGATGEAKEHAERRVKLLEGKAEPVAEPVADVKPAETATPAEPAKPSPKPGRHPELDYDALSRMSWGELIQAAKSLPAGLQERIAIAKKAKEKAARGKDPVAKEQAARDYARLKDSADAEGLAKELRALGYSPHPNVAQTFGWPTDSSEAPIQKSESIGHELRQYFGYKPWIHDVWNSGATHPGDKAMFINPSTRDMSRSGDTGTLQYDLKPGLYRIGGTKDPDKYLMAWKDQPTGEIQKTTKISDAQVRQMLNHWSRNFEAARLATIAPSEAGPQETAVKDEPQRPQQEQPTPEPQPAAEEKVAEPIATPAAKDENAPLEPPQAKPSLPVVSANPAPTPTPEPNPSLLEQVKKTLGGKDQARKVVPLYGTPKTEPVHVTAASLLPMHYLGGQEMPQELQRWLLGNSQKEGMVIANAQEMLHGDRMALPQELQSVGRNSAYLEWKGNGPNGPWYAAGSTPETINMWNSRGDVQFFRIGPLGEDSSEVHAVTISSQAPAKPKRERVSAPVPNVTSIPAHEIEAYHAELDAHPMEWSKKGIQWQDNDGGRHTTDGHVSDSGLGVWPAEDGDSWHVGHAASGVALGDPLETEEEAKRAAAMYDRMPVDWSEPDPEKIGEAGGEHIASAPDHRWLHDKAVAAKWYQDNKLHPDVYKKWLDEEGLKKPSDIRSLLDFSGVSTHGTDEQIKARLHRLQSVKAAHQAKAYVPKAVHEEFSGWMKGSKLKRNNEEFKPNTKATL